MRKRKHAFLHLPQYPGGKESFKKYFEENLIYPEKAVIEKTKGIVYLNANIDDNGYIE